MTYTIILFLVFLLHIQTILSNEIKDNLRIDHFMIDDNYAFYYDYDSRTLFYHDLHSDDSSYKEFRVPTGSGPGEVQMMMSGLQYLPERSELAWSCPQNNRIMHYTFPDFELSEEFTVRNESTGIGEFKFVDGLYYYFSMLPVDLFLSRCIANDPRDCKDARISVDEGDERALHELRFEKTVYAEYTNIEAIAISRQKPVYRKFDVEDMEIVEERFIEDFNSEVVNRNGQIFIDGAEGEINGTAHANGRLFIHATGEGELRTYKPEILYELHVEGDDVRTEPVVELDANILEVDSYNGRLYALISDDSRVTQDARIVEVELD